MTLYASPGRDLSDKPRHTLHGTWLDVAEAVYADAADARGMIDHLRRPDESRRSAKKRVGQALGSLMRIDMIRTVKSGRLELTNRGVKALARARGDD